MNTESMPSTTLHDLQDPSTSAYKKAKRLHLKTTKNRPKHIDADWSPFRAAEKKYKARFPPPDLSDVLDLAAGDPSREAELSQGGWRGRPVAVQHRALDLACDTAKKAYVFPSIPGPCPLSQRNEPRHTLCRTERRPWNIYTQSLRKDTPREDIQPRASSSTFLTISPDPPGSRQLISNEPADKLNYHSLASTPKMSSAPSTTMKAASATSLIPKLRWANVGWYYHWGTKHYDFARGKIEVSDVYKDVCKRAVRAIPWEEVFGEGPKTGDWGEEEPDWRTWDESYEPDAGIVNFYQTKDTLMAHVDRSEVCATSPLVSVSLGCAAIFLIGGLTRDVEPIPILLRSGDVVIMSGPQCRRAYHGVPRILDNTLPLHLREEDGNSDWHLYEAYMRTTRINVNVRQVFPKGFDPGLNIEKPRF